MPEWVTSSKGPEPSSIIHWLGVGALFSGVALVMHILAGISLRLALAATASILLCGVATIYIFAEPSRKRWITIRGTVGATAGLAATASYDLSKYVLSVLDPSPYNPFEALKVFGVLFVGQTASGTAIAVSGLGFHVLNGISFGVAYCFFFGSKGIWAGMAWGIFLEGFQIALYPGWLDVRWVSEFVQISALSHLVYGAVLGKICKVGLVQRSAQ